MEGPTPVSALIHAATLVTAGIFLIIRCSSLFELTKITLSIISIIGALTAFFASSVGFVQNDLKRIIAYSTCSQLGYMMLACGLSHYSVAFFHLANHAIFKALLFLGAGSIIHGLLDEQDLRKMGSLILFFPLSYVMILIGSLALVGFPFLTGFYSKDIILEVAAAKATVTGNFTYLLGCLAAFGTAFYSFRLILLCFINSCNSYKLYIEQAHDGALRMVIPLLILGLGSIFWGFISKDLVIGFGSPIFSTSIQTSTYQLIQIDSEFLPASIKLIPLILTLIGICLSFLLINCSFLYYTRFIYEFKMSKSYRTLYTFLSKKWYFDQLMGDLIVQRVMNFGYNTSFLLLDKGFIEVLGPSGFSNSSISFSRANSIAQNGQVSNYSFIMLFSIITVISVSFCFYYNVFITSTLFSTLLFLSYWV
jgi:NADH-ubiquinone oxidoreductase chain 5